MDAIALGIVCISLEATLVASVCVSASFPHILLALLPFGILSFTADICGTFSPPLPLPLPLPLPVFVPS